LGSNASILSSELSFSALSGTAFPPMSPSFPPAGTCANWSGASLWPTLIQGQPSPGKLCWPICRGSREVAGHPALGLLGLGDVMEEQELFRQLRERAQLCWSNYEDWYGPITVEELRESEDLLGFPLPGFVRRLYSQVGNGGFGPGYGGVLGLVYGATDESNINAIERYRGWQDWQPDIEDYALEPGEVAVPWVWPNRFLAICHWGCAIYSCIDCNTEDVAVLRFRQDCYHPTRPVADLMRPEAISFAGWLEAWLNGTLKG
jgi:hypothetical protein